MPKHLNLVFEAKDTLLKEGHGSGILWVLVIQCVVKAKKGTHCLTEFIRRHKDSAICNYVHEWSLPGTSTDEHDRGTCSWCSGCCFCILWTCTRVWKIDNGQKLFTNRCILDVAIDCLLDLVYLYTLFTPILTNRWCWIHFPLHKKVNTSLMM